MLQRILFCLLISVYADAQTHPMITSWLIKDSVNINSTINNIYFSQERVYVEKVIHNNPKSLFYSFPINADTSNLKTTFSKKGLAGLMINGTQINYGENKIDFKKVSNETALVNGVSISLNPFQHSKIIGYASDGFPIYGPYGFYNNNGTGKVVRMKSGYIIKKAPSYTLKRNKRNTNHQMRHEDRNIFKLSKDSVVFSDYYKYEYSESPDVLDEHNGRFCITPEYPYGMYCYFLTIDSIKSPVYPYLIGSTLKGNFLTATEDTIMEPNIKYNYLKNQNRSLENENKLPLSIFYAKKSELIVMQSSGMINEDIKLQLLDAEGTLLKETILYQGSTIAYFDAQALYNGTYSVKIIRYSGFIEEKINVNKN